MQHNNPLVLKVFLEQTPNTMEYLTRTKLEAYSKLFHAAGWECENSVDIYSILGIFAEIGIVEIELDHRNRVNKIKRLI